MKVAVVTPTIGSDHLRQCLESVQNQTYQNLTHYVFLDGQKYFDKINPFLYEVSGKREIKTIKLEDNVGKDWYGHRVYSACSFLVNADAICYLDEDNWYESNHVEEIVKTLEKGNDWSFSLRKIYDKDGNFICEDNCESLGKWPVYFNDSIFHVDTSSFGVRINVAVNIGHSWYGKWGADRQFFETVKKYFTKYDCTKQYSSCYRLDGNPNSVTADFFQKGNEINHSRHNGQWPWLKDTPSSINIGPGIKILT